MEAQGHHTKLLVNDSVQQTQWLKAAGKRRYEERTGRTGRKHAPYDPSKDKELQTSLRQLTPGGVYYFAWVVVFKWADQFLNGMHADVRTIGLDAGHCTHLRFDGDEGGVMTAIDAVTTNRNRVMLVRGHFCANESEHVWATTLEFASQHILLFRDGTSLDVTKPTVHRDGKAEISKTLRQHAPGLKPLLCAMHGALAAMRTTGLAASPTEAQKVYRDLVYTLRVSSFDRKYQALAPMYKKYLEHNSHVNQEGRYLSKFVADDGRVQATLNTLNQQEVQCIVPRMTQAFSESVMACSKSENGRGLAPLPMIQSLLAAGIEQLTEQKRLAMECTDTVPPKVRAMLNVAEKQIMESGTTTRVTFLDTERTMAQVYPAVNTPGQSSISWNVKLHSAANGYRESTCACGFSRATCFPCIDVLRAAKASGINDLTAFVRPVDRTEAWRTSLQNISTDNLQPATAELVEQSPIQQLLIPLSLPRRAGKPRTERFKSAMEGGGKSPKRQRSTGAVWHMPASPAGCAAASSSNVDSNNVDSTEAPSWPGSTLPGARPSASASALGKQPVRRRHKCQLCTELVGKDVFGHHQNSKQCKDFQRAHRNEEDKSTQEY